MTEGLTSTNSRRLPCWRALGALSKRSESVSANCDYGRSCVYLQILPPTFIGFPHSHSNRSMSSSSFNPNPSFSRFEDLFDTALREYSQKTGKDIATEQLTNRLLRCDSSDAVLEILRDQAHAFNQFRNGDWKVQLMRRLKPTVDILLGLSTSGVFGEGIGLVRQTKSTYSCRSSSYTLQRLPPAKAIFAGVGLLLAVCVPLAA